MTGEGRKEEARMMEDDEGLSPRCQATTATPELLPCFVLRLINRLVVSDADSQTGLPH